MGTTYYDSEGQALFLHGVPIRAVKRAFFTGKQMLKMAINSVTYDFEETAKGGAVIFQNNYTGWEFIAPDDRLDFDSYSGMTLGDTLSAIRNVLASNPIPSWDKFAQWVYNMGYYPKYVVSQCTAYIRPTGGSYTQITAPDFTSMQNTGFVGFLDVLIAAVGSVSLPMSSYLNGDRRFECEVMVKNGDSTLATMTFIFRE